jgi:hypothetical protein
MWGDMIPRFHESCQWRFLWYSSGTFLGGFFCYLTCSVLENRSYRRIVHFRSMDLWQVKTSTEFLTGSSRMHRKGVFVADFPDRGMMYPHTVGFASHIRNGNFDAVCIDVGEIPRTRQPSQLHSVTAGAFAFRPTLRRTPPRHRSTPWISQLIGLEHGVTLPPFSTDCDSLGFTLHCEQEISL